MISVGGFEYDDDEGEDFIGLFCTICDKEMGYDPCVNCEDEKEIEESDSELFCNYYRLRLAETMEKAKNLADLNKFEDAKKLLVALELEISKSMYSTNQKVKLFLEEIKAHENDLF